MNYTTLKQIEDKLWEQATALRSNANISSNQYFLPVLGMIFLRYAEIKFNATVEDFKSNPDNADIPQEFLDIEIKDFCKTENAVYLAPECRWKNIAQMEGEKKTCQVINSIMEKIEADNEVLSGILPRYDSKVITPQIIKGLIETFDNNLLDNLTDDFIGRIYEYFVNKFSEQGAQESGMFFTPESLVELIARIVEPDSGILLDPACGSGGMFIAAMRLAKDRGIDPKKLTIKGHEKIIETSTLCRMNLAVHGISNNIATGENGNTYYMDSHDLFDTESKIGKCSAVMANPPFNDSGVDESAATNPRITLGSPSINQKKAVSNANYLWLQYFYSYLNETGRAGFVLASSASDASGKNELAIRKKLVETGHVEVMVSVANNFFYTLSLPCQLWFYNKNKKEPAIGRTLFIDARNYYTEVSRKINEWTSWQRKNLASIVYLFRGETEKYNQLLEEYTSAIWEYYNEDKCEVALPGDFQKEISDANTNQGLFFDEANPPQKVLHEEYCIAQYDNVIKTAINKYIEYLGTVTKEQRAQVAEDFSKANDKPFKFGEIKKYLTNYLSEFEAKAKEHLQMADALAWIRKNFPDGKYHNIPGLCYSADIAEIAEHNYSLTPGAYVGVAEREDDNEVPFQERLSEINAELQNLHAEANDLMNVINGNLKEILG